MNFLSNGNFFGIEKDVKIDINAFKENCDNDRIFGKKEFFRKQYMCRLFV